MKWPRVEIISNYTTGEVLSITYTMTPEEFVKHIQTEGERIYVTNKACHECHYFPETCMTKAMKQELLSEETIDHHCPECVCVSVGHRQGRYELPDFVICYGYYYQHSLHNRYLRAIREADLVTFVDIEGLPGLRGSGLCMMEGWEYNNSEVIASRRGWRSE